METMTEVQKVKQWLKGELTWAEVEGTTLEDAKAMAQIGVDMAAAGRLEEAKAIFEGMVEVNPKDSAAQGVLGTVYERLGRFADALAAYSRALEWDAENPVALANRGELRLKQGDTTGGAADLLLAVTVDPEGRTAAGRRAAGIAKALALAAVAAGEKVSKTH